MARRDAMRCEATRRDEMRCDATRGDAMRCDARIARVFLSSRVRPSIHLPALTPTVRPSYASRRCPLFARPRVLPPPPKSMLLADRGLQSATGNRACNIVPSCSRSGSCSPLLLCRCSLSLSLSRRENSLFAPRVTRSFLFLFFSLSLFCRTTSKRTRRKIDGEGPVLFRTTTTTITS